MSPTEQLQNLQMRLDSLELALQVMTGLKGASATDCLRNIEERLDPVFETTEEKGEKVCKYRNTFNGGAAAIFDHIYMRAANHWHANPELNKHCQEENDVAESWVREALFEVAPDAAAGWRSITDLAAENFKLKSEISKLRNFNG